MTRFRWGRNARAASGRTTRSEAFWQIRVIVDAQQPDPKKLEELRRHEGQLSRQIQFLLNNAGATDEDQRESAKQLRDLRRQRTEAAEKIRLHEIPRNVKIPTEQDVENILTKLGDALVAAAEGKLGDEMGTVRQIIKMLTGGRIDLFQQGERKAYQGWLEGRCRVRLLQYLVSAAFCRSRFLSPSPQNVEKLPKKTRCVPTTPHLAVEYRGFPDTMCGSFLMFAVHFRSIIGWLAQDY